MKPHRQVRTHFDVLIVGGGNAGISTAARLIRKNIGGVAVIEPRTIHTYRPLLSYVGGGQATLSSAERTQRSVTPDGCVWIEDSVVRVDPSAKTVTTATGRTFTYGDLVLGAGLVPDHDALAGIDDALNSPAVASNYLDRAEKTWELVHALPAGSRAVFTVPRAPVSCTGTTLKPLFLAAAHWQARGRHPGIEITLVVDRPQILGVSELDSVLNKRLRELGVKILWDTRVASLDSMNDRLDVICKDSSSEISYDFLHLVPPYRGRAWVAESGLAGDHPLGLVDIDSRTFRHRTHDTVWAVGDGAAVDTDPSGGALRKQVSVLVDNILASRSGTPLSSYDGYTVAPILLDAHRLVAGEFDRTGAIQSSLPSFLNPITPRRTAWAFDRYVLPQVYWHSILAGRV